MKRNDKAIEAVFWFEELQFEATPLLLELLKDAVQRERAVQQPSYQMKYIIRTLWMCASDARVKNDIFSVLIEILNRVDVDGYFLSASN